MEKKTCLRCWTTVCFIMLWVGVNLLITLLGLIMVFMLALRGFARVAVIVEYLEVFTMMVIGKLKISMLNYCCW